MSERITDERLAEIIDRCRRDWLSLTNPTTKLEDELWNYLKAEREHSRKLEEWLNNNTTFYDTEGQKVQGGLSDPTVVQNV